MTPLDRAYARLADRDLEYGRELSVHAPMVVEVLHTLGRDDRIEAWLDRAQIKLRPAPEARAPITDEGVAAALGAIDRAPDWVAYFDRALTIDSPRAVLDAWVPRLSDGLLGAAFHGILRAGHAARALSEADTIERRRELARGLAYWAARHAPMTTSEAPSGEASIDLRDALDALPTSVDALTPRQGLINPRIDERIAPHRAAILACANARLAGSPLQAAHALQALAAHVLLDFEADPSALFALAHGVTSMGAIEHILPWISPRSADVLLRHARVAIAALRVAFTGAPRSRPAPSTTFDRVLDRALSSDDDHDLKLGEACLRGRRRDAALFDGVLAVWLGDPAGR